MLRNADSVSTKQHRIAELAKRLPENRRGGWILEVYLRKYFDTLDRHHQRAFINKRVRTMCTHSQCMM